MKFLTATLLLLLLNACSAPDEPNISLYLAVQRGDIDQVERHIYWKTDINAVFPNGMYPLHEAASQGRIILLNVLMKNGAELNAKNYQQHTPVDLAILTGHIQTTQQLIKLGASFDATNLLLQAAAINISDRDIIRFLVSEGADTESKDNNGDTPLIIAIKNQNNRLVNYLVSQGAFVNARDKQQNSVLKIAKDLGATEIEQLLIRNGASIQ